MLKLISRAVSLEVIFKPGFPRIPLRKSRWRGYIEAFIDSPCQADKFNLLLYDTSGGKVHIEQSEASDAILARANAVELPMPDNLIARVDHIECCNRVRWDRDGIFDVAFPSLFYD